MSYDKVIRFIRHGDMTYTAYEVDRGSREDWILQQLERPAIPAPKREPRPGEWSDWYATYRSWRACILFFGGQFLCIAGILWWFCVLVRQAS